MSGEDGVVWLNPSSLPAGAQVRSWLLDAEGNPVEEPITLETAGTRTELSRADAIRLGRALIAAAERA